MTVNKKVKLEELLDCNNLPRHIAIIMDGNGRWAGKRFMPRTLGHRAGIASLKEVVRACSDLGVSILTVFAFSTENWKRPLQEVDYLMKLLVEYLRRELNELHANAVRINILGEYNSLPHQCQLEIAEALQITRDNRGLCFNIALNYGSRAEIIAAVKKLAAEILAGEISGEEISEESFAAYLTTAGMSDPDLLIRTAGEMRISNFLLWQIAYTELWVTDCLWPDFSREHLMQAIWDYQQRERRFGGLSNRQQGEENA